MNPVSIRNQIINALLSNPVLGENYVDWHSIDGECGVTVTIDGKHFDIIIRNKEVGHE